MKFKSGDIIFPVRKHMFNKDIRRLVVKAYYNCYTLEILDNSDPMINGPVGRQYKLDKSHSAGLEKDYQAETTHNDILKDLCSK